MAGWCFLMTRGRQPVVDVCEGWARAPWEAQDASLPLTTDARVFIAGSTPEFEDVHQP